MHPGEALDLLKYVRDEYEAARYAVGPQLRAMAEDLAALQTTEAAGISRPDLNRCARRLEVTYIVRLFATFEAVLLDYWQRAMRRRTRPQVHPLMNRIADHRAIDPATRVAAHAVRACRNEIVHNALDRPTVDFHTCKSSLGRFLSWLPPAGW